MSEFVKQLVTAIIIAPLWAWILCESILSWWKVLSLLSGGEIKPHKFEPRDSHNMDIKEAFDVLKTAMQDEDYAWTWHCNIAMPFIDEGVSHEVANRGAARVMRTIFGIDVTSFNHWKQFESIWEKDNET